MFGLKRKELSDIDKAVYGNEIKRLTKERNKFMKLYEIANQYKAEYEKLADDYKKKNLELDKLNAKTKELNNELSTLIEKMKKK